LFTFSRLDQSLDGRDAASSVALALGSPWVQHALIGFGPTIVCAHLNAVEWSAMLPTTKAKMLGPLCPVALVYSEPQLAE
jgi:hypothetical protein